MSKRIGTIKGAECGQKMCRINICATNDVIKVINEYWMDPDVNLKKKKTLIIKLKQMTEILKG
jgi:hypothetical protein